MNQYEKELRGTVALTYIKGSLADFGRKIKVRIDEENQKPSPDTALIGLLCDAAKVGWELCRKDEGEWRRARKRMEKAAIYKVKGTIACRICGQWRTTQRKSIPHDQECPLRRTDA